MEEIRTTTEKLIKEWQNAKSTQRKKDIWDNLRKNLTKQEQKHIKHYCLRNSQLTLGVDSSVWLYIISLKKERLLKSLNQGLSQENTISKIFLRLEA